MGYSGGVRPFDGPGYRNRYGRADPSASLRSRSFTTKAEGEGTGLGLATVYGIAKQNEGFVTLDSQPSVGTIATLCLPQVRPADPTSPSPLVIETARGDERILVAEDDAMVGKALERLLLRAGYDVVVALDGQEALERFRASAPSFDLVFADAVMPGLSGRQLFDEVRTMRPKLPFLMGTGYGSAHFDPELVEAAGCDFVAKPYNVDVLLVKIRELLAP